MRLFVSEKIGARATRAAATGRQLCRRRSSPAAGGLLPLLILIVGRTTGFWTLAGCLLKVDVAENYQPVPCSSLCTVEHAATAAGSTGRKTSWWQSPAR